MRPEQSGGVLRLAVVVAVFLAAGFAVGTPPPAPAFRATVTAAAQDASAVEASLGLDRSTRRLIQQGLRNEGFDAGAPDGLFGPRTRAAIRAWQASREQAETGYLDSVQASALRSAGLPPTPADANVLSAPVPAGVSEAEPLDAANAALSGAATAEPAAPAVVESPPAPTEAVISPGENAPAAQAAQNTQLPPEILVDRRLVRVKRLLAEDDHQAAHDVMNEIVALQREHVLALPPEFPFKYAQVAFAAGLAETAVASLNEYLLTAGQAGEFYREALELLDSAEEAVRRADAERRRAEAARQRAEEERRRVAARQRENDELARRQAEAAAVPLPRDQLRSGGLAPEMVRMPTGRFQYIASVQMGPRWVSIDRPFAIAKYEVTRAEFARFAERGRYRTEAERSQDDDHVCGSPAYGRRRTWKQPRFPGRQFSQTDAHPVVCVTIRDAMEYAEWLSQETGHTYRLPSAAEWQYAARAGSEEAMRYIQRTRRNNCGRGNLEEHPRGARIICTDGASWTAEVGRFHPNAVGLHDMIGNVSEWVLACAHPIPNTDNYVAPRSDGAPDDPRTCNQHFAYGSTFSHPAYAWYATLNSDNYDPTSLSMGFRVLRELDENQSALR